MTLDDLYWKSCYKTQNKDSQMLLQSQINIIYVTLTLTKHLTQKSWFVIVIVTNGLFCPAVFQYIHKEKINYLAKKLMEKC